ncbi:MAG: hypothetical protein LT071_01935 [Nocardioides sp.]|nr:hypothetical protein [Nocardioides sp.]
MSRPVRGLRPLLGVGLSLALAGSLSACSGDDPEPPPPQPPSTSTSEPATPEAPLEVRLGQVVGRLPKDTRVAVRRQVSDVVDTWWQAAYLGGDYPRSEFANAFPGFTKRAAALARDDQKMLTNSVIGPDVDSVSAIERSVVVDVVATDRRPRAATARFTLRFATTGEQSGVTIVRGRLYLTRRLGPWRVFGYDVSKEMRS